MLKIKRGAHQSNLKEGKRDGKSTVGEFLKSNFERVG
jgi:hypothetical protein